MSPTDLVGRVLAERYRVVRLLGQGGMGAVFEATQIDLNRRVAIKVLAPELADDARCVERFRREAEAAAALGHPSIVQVTDFGERPGEPMFLVMEHLSGESLEALLIREGAIEPRRARALMAQVLSALETAHAAGIVHRDLKPSNVFVTPLGGGAELVKLLDFGIAKLRESSGYERLTATGAFVGTTRYASPEQLDGRPVDERADIYAAGVLLYCMVTGRPPFDGDSAQLALRVLTSEPPDPRTYVPSLGPGLVGVIARAMRKDASARFVSASEMAAALGASIEQTAVDGERVRKAIARPPASDAHAVAPAAVAPAMSAPPAQRRKRGGIAPWIAALFVAGAIPIFLCVVVALPMTLAGPDEPTTSSPAAPPVSVDDGSEVADDDDPSALLPPECDELREIACNEGRALTRTATCARIALMRSRLRRGIERDPGTREPARDECRREADELRRRNAD